MRIAIVGPADPRAFAGELDPGWPAVEPVPGAGLVSRLAHAHLRDSPDDEIDIVTLGIGVEEPVEMTGRRVRLHIGPYRTRRRARDGFAVERDFVRSRTAELAPDVAHAHWSYEFALGALASGVPTIVTVHDWAPAVLRYDPHPYRAVRLGMSVATLARADHLTAPSPMMCRRVSRWSRGQVTLVPNGIEDELLLRSGPRDRPGAVVLAVNQGFGRLKNVGVLLQAWPRVLAAVPDARLRLVGDWYGPEGPAAAWASRAGLGRGVEFVGEHAAAGVLREMDAATLFVHPSREESFGMVVVEAMARGLPVLGGAGSGAVPWLLRDGAGVTTDVRRPDALADGIVSLLRDPATRSRVRAVALRRVEEELLLSGVARRFRELYARVSASSGAGS